ncbi:MAG: transposase [Gemmatimonadaceae bacterium]|nr:transposase [Gemmatimonadaceae bacterium]
MTPRRKESNARRERRAFPGKFKQEAVRLMHERRAKGGTLTHVAQGLDVRPEQLREWTRVPAARPSGLAAAGVVETPEQEGSGCGARMRGSRRSVSSQTKSRCTSRGSRGEVRLYCAASARASGATHGRCA